MFSFLLSAPLFEYMDSLLSLVTMCLKRKKKSRIGCISLASGLDHLVRNHGCISRPDLTAVGMIGHWECGVSCSGPASNVNAWESIVCSCWLLRMQRSSCKDLDICSVSRCGWENPCVTNRSFCYQPGFLASLINRNWSEARQEIQARLYWGPCCSRGNENKQQFPLLARSPKGDELVPYMGWE